VRRHKLGEVENEYTSEKCVLFAISVPKIFTMVEICQSSDQKNKFAQFLKHGIECRTGDF